MPAFVRRATIEDAPVVSSILIEAAAWLEQGGSRMWKADELRPDRIAADVSAGLFFVACLDDEPLGTIRFQLSDPLFWPDMPEGESAYVHRLAVRRRAAGQGLSTLLLAWAADRARVQGRRFLRLDCEASRTKLRALYERAGFRHHSDREVGPYLVARYEMPLDGNAV